MANISDAHGFLFAVEPFYDQHVIAGEFVGKDLRTNRCLENR